MAPQWDDDRLLEELREALRFAGPVPEWVTRTGEAAWTWRTVDDELALATLVFDSSAADGPLVRTTTDAGRLLEFTAGALTLRLTVGGGTLLGQLEPEGPAIVTVRRSDGTARTFPTDDLGCFDLPRPEGAFRISCEHAAGGLMTGLLRI